MAEQSVAGKDNVAFGDSRKLPDDMLSRLVRTDLAEAARAQDIHAGVEIIGENEVWLHYGGEPVIRPGVAKDLAVTTVQESDSQVNLAVPTGWNCERLGPARFRIFCPTDVPDRNTLTVTVDSDSVDFTVLGPGEAKGFAAGENVATCPKCWARIEACMCEK
jgi:hypothetical protein